METKSKSPSDVAEAVRMSILPDSNNHTIDFKRIASEALQHSETLCQQWLPHGKKVGQEWTATNPRRPDDGKAGNFKINLNTGLWSDFAANEKGGDLISLLAYLKGSGQKDAAITIATWLGTGLPAGGKDAATQQNDAAPVMVAVAQNDKTPPVTFSHQYLGTPSARYSYKNKDGALCFYVCRFDKPDGTKEIRPRAIFMDMLTGSQRWDWKWPDAPRPLFNLPELLNRADADVVVVEGEKSAEAAKILLPEHVVITWSGGSKRADQTDWSHCRDRAVLIWRDNDEPGTFAGDVVARCLAAAGAESIDFINEQLFCKRSKNDADRELPKGYDAADALEEGWTDADVAVLSWEKDFLIAVELPASQAELDAQIEQVAAPVTVAIAPEVMQDEPVDAEEPAAMPAVICQGNFRVDDAGVWYTADKAEGEPELKSIRLCARIDIVAVVRDHKNENWCLRLVFKDIEGNPHVWNMPRTMLANSQKDDSYRAVLLGMGFDLEQGTLAKKQFALYLHKCQPTAKARSVTQTGWVSVDGSTASVFVTPEKTYGSIDDEQVLLMSEQNSSGDLSKRGTLSDWQATVARYCGNNSRLMFAVCVSLAPPLLALVNEENGGFNLKGSSSIGKSVCLTVAGSVWGGKSYVKTWRATSNGVEGLLVRRNDLLTILDEMGQVDGKEIGSIAYMAMNGSGKQRSSQTGSSRPVRQFRTMVLSSGETGLESHMLSEKKRATAGQDVRIPDIAADAGAGLGVFEALHGVTGANVFATTLKQNAAESYGTAGDAWLEYLSSNFDAATEATRKHSKAFLQLLDLDGADGQVRRVAQRFSLVAAAGEVATEQGITGWTVGAPSKAVRSCFQSWLDNRGGKGSHEHTAIVSQVREFIEQHGSFRFQSIRAKTPTFSHEAPADELDSDRPVANRAGFRREDDNNPGCFDYIFLSEVFKTEVCKGFDVSLVKKVLDSIGAIKRDAQGRFLVQERLPELGNVRVIKVIGSKLFNDGDVTPVTPLDS